MVKERSRLNERRFKEFFFFILDEYIRCNKLIVQTFSCKINKP